MHRPTLTSPAPETYQIRVRGLVQGVGFRPTVWQQAQQWKITGRILNDGEGVLIEAQGDHINDFIQAISSHCPPLARIDDIQHQQTPCSFAFAEFIIDSSQETQITTGIAPDAASCPQCLAEIYDPANRRFHYPFTNCTHCGPRLSIIRTIPYDRANTSMSRFRLCPDCQKEYDNPNNRRFHAQPNACPNCGPTLWLQDQDGCSKKNPIEAAVARLKQGQILAVKGIGGFHLICDAHNDKTIRQLRKRKHRPSKPFALMANNLAQIKRYARINAEEAALLESPEAPVLLLESKPDSALPNNIAPGQNTLGFMLPYSPLHHLLLKTFGNAIVATSGNSGGLPPCINNDQALTQLTGIADAHLLHDRPIVNRVDDSVARWVGNQLQILRRARGYAPTSLPLPPGFAQSPKVLAFGSELKNTFCLLTQGQAILSQHMGDLENLQTYEDYQRNLALYQNLYKHQPARLAVDRHPDYLSTKLGQETAKAQGLAIVEVQHHHAHIASCLAENQWPLDAGKVIGIALDGIGLGDDDTFWGGEILLADYHNYQRLAHLTPVALPGGTQAMRQPWRNLVAQLIYAFGNDWKDQAKAIKPLDKLPIHGIEKMLQQKLNSPLASSAGRLFDAVAAAMGICTAQIHYEGQAAIELESATTLDQCNSEWDNAFPLTLHQSKDKTWQIDPTNLWPSLLDNLARSKPIAQISARFHAGLARAFSKAAQKQAKILGIQNIVLSGGVMQNRLLLQLIQIDLETTGLTVLTHQQIPANDGGLSFGQAVIAAAQPTLEESPLCV